MSSGIVLLIVVAVILVIVASVNGIRNGLISRQIHSQILKIIFSKLKI